MKITLDIFGALLAFAAIGSAISKLLKVPDVMAAMTSVGVKANLVPVLALLEIAGGTGVILGIWHRTLGIIAAAALVLYFLGAIVAHVRVKSKMADSAAAIGIFVIATITTILELKR